jgi:NAD(P)-dependent dehydrogenase (short-subunit alcohol dehydrogenase family)
MNLELTGKTALITGGSKGIGYAVAKGLAAEGVNLHLAARNADQLATAREQLISEFAVSVDIHPCDLSQSGDTRELANKCAEIDILVNNAGAIPGGSLAEVSDDLWRTSWDLKVFGYISMMRNIYGHMKARGGGVILNICGTAGNQIPSDYVAGITANGALITLTRALGGTSLNDGIRVLGINPGDMENERGEKFLRLQAARNLGDAEKWREMYADQPGGAVANSEDIANAVRFFVSPRARFVSGTVLTIDGGMSASQAVVGA